MRRTNKRIRREHCDIVETFDTDYIFDRTRPKLMKIVDYPRKTIFINADADPDATEVQTIRYGVDGT